MQKTEGGPSRRSSETTLREYYGRKAGQGFMAPGNQVAAPQGGQKETKRDANGGAGRQGAAAAPSLQSFVPKLLAQLSPAKAIKASGRCGAALGGTCDAAALGLSPECKPAHAHLRQHQHEQPPITSAQSTDSGGIPAFHPASSQHEPTRFASPLDDDSDTPPGNVQLRPQHPSQAALPPPQQQRRRQPGVQQASLGTPGDSEGSSLGRAINEQIASSIADMFMPTPTHEPHSGSDSPPAAAPDAALKSPGGTSNGVDTSSVGDGLEMPEAQQLAASLDDGCAELPVPPPPPAMLRTAMTESSTLELQSFLSPVFMSRKQRPMACEMDEPGRTTAFPPKARRRTGRLHRFIAGVFGCFVPLPGSRSPAPSLRTPSSRRTTSSQGASPVRPMPAFRMEPLRQSLGGLALHDADLRASLAAVAVANSCGGRCGAGARASVALSSGAISSGAVVYADLLGLQQRRREQEEEEEEEGLRMNMASPVLPSQPGNRAATPPGHALGGDGGEVGANALAKRNLMDVLRSKENAGAVQQEQRGQQGHGQQPLQPRQTSQASSTGVGVPQQAAKAKASHVSLAQLLSPTAGTAAGQAAKAGLGRQPRSGAKRRREALAASHVHSGKLPGSLCTDDAPAVTPKRRDLSRPSYRSEALHQMLSPPARVGSFRRGAAQGSGSEQAPHGEGVSGHARLRRSLSVPASPMPGVAAAAAVCAAGRGSRGAGAAAGSSVPSSPLFAGPRLTRAATVRAAAAQRKLAGREAQSSAYLARSPHQWLRVAAAEGLSLRHAAVLASPGKSARRHHHDPSPPARNQPPDLRQQASSSAAAAAAGQRAATPGSSRFDSFETGVEPYSARLLTTEKQRHVDGSGLGPVATNAAASAAPLLALGALEPSSGVDFARLAADRDAYLQMLQMLAEGLEVERPRIDAHKQPPPLPAGQLAAAGAQSRPERLHQAADGDDTMRVRIAPSQEWLDTSRTHAFTAVYSLHGASTKVSVNSADEVVSARHLVPSTPHHNALFGRDATPTKSSPVALQRMVSMSAAAAAQVVEQDQWQHQGELPAGAAGDGGSGRQASSGSVAASSSAHSISFGSGCREPLQGRGSTARQQQHSQPNASHPGRRRDPWPGLQGVNARLAALAELLQTERRRGQHCGLRELQSAGFSTHDLQALKAWLARQGR